MAYCFDMWASASPDLNHIPPIIRLLRVESYPLGDSRFVFNQIADFISIYKTKLFNAFKAKYAGEDALLALQQIEMDLGAGHPIQQLESIHGQLMSELDYYKKKRKEINTQLKKLPGTGPETDALRTETRAISGAINTINKRNTIEYLTNLGILPNYAFPETGVHINAQIISKVDDPKGARYHIEDFGEIVRPASSAITELAPGNIFYSQGHKLESQGLEIFSADSYETWRFCSNCDALVKDVDVPKNQTLCPKCQHNSWGSLANKKTLVKLEGVMSVNDREASKISDNSDDRERKFYHKSVHLITDQTSSRGAKVLKRVPFGIEFYSSADYLEVNTGIREDGFWGNRNLLINDKENPEIGFVVCKTCGKATEKQLTRYELDRHIRAYHFGYCVHRNAEYEGTKDDIFNELYIYRSFQTEALKILLPVQDFRTSEKVSIFKAGLLLGLKNYYKGHPDHVHIRDYEEFNVTSGRKERFLVMYESIPGGTGYLSRLFNTEEFTKLLTIAYDHIKHCTCKDEGKDGCYKCIYTYANQYDREVLSRNEAEILFRDIIEKSTEWNEVNSLTNLTHIANDEESELEERFVQLLKNEYKSKPNSDFEEITEFGCRKYRLTIKESENSVCYEIWPQNLGNSLAGVKYTTRPDFVFKCVSLIIDGDSQPFEKIQEIKDIVVYLDGYQFHATKENMRVLGDLKIRNAITQSGRYYQWIFSWEDIIKATTSKSEDLLQQKMDTETIAKVSSRIPALKSFDFSKIKKNHNFSRFGIFLKQPLSNLDLKLWSAVQLFACQTKILSKGLPFDKVDSFLASGNELEFEFNPGLPDQFSYSDNLKFADELKIVCLTQLKGFEIKSAIIHNIPAGDYLKENWELFWQTYNLQQFHDYKGIETQAASKSESIDQILENFRPELHAIVKKLISKNISINKEFDFDILEDDVIVAQAELGSESHKFFLYPFDEESRNRLINLGYQEFTIENFNLNKLAL